MTRLEFTCGVAAPLDDVWEFHRSPESLKYLTPPGMQVAFDSPPEPPRLCVRYPFTLVRFGVRIRWEAEYVAFDPPHGFTDRQIRGPFASWEHQHRFVEVAGGVLIVDTLLYTLPLGPLGALADVLFVRAVLRRLFAYRRRALHSRFGSLEVESAPGPEC